MNLIYNSRRNHNGELGRRAEAQPGFSAAFWSILALLFDFISLQTCRTSFVLSNDYRFYANLLEKEVTSWKQSLDPLFRQKWLYDFVLILYK